MTPDPVPGQRAAPVCYRHSGRETYIRCTRCERPICPDCMISASVGFQCPDCVRQGAASVPPQRTPFGGRAGRDPGYVSRILIASCVLVWFAELALGPALRNRFYLLGLARDFDTNLPVGVAAGEWYRLLTNTFLHDSPLPFHLLLNMYALYLFGPPLEAALGRARFLALYLLSALGGSAASYLLNAPNNAALGASGAIFGLFAAYFVVSRRLGRDVSQLWVLLGLNLVLGFAIPNIDWRAHLGGLVTGAAVALALVYAPRRRRGLVQALGAVAVLVAVLAVITMRTAELTGASGAQVASCAVQAPLEAEAGFLQCVTSGG